MCRGAPSARWYPSPWTAPQLNGRTLDRYGWKSSRLWYRQARNGMSVIQVPGGQIELIPRGSAVPDDRREFLLERINSVIATNWRSVKSTWWSREHSPFGHDYGLAFFHAAGQIVAYFIYRHLSLDGVPLLYAAGTAVDASHQGKRYYQVMQAHALTAAWHTIQPAPSQVYVAWRTRNPSVWMVNSRMCKVVVPSLWDGQ